MFCQSTIEKVKYYVYFLRDPRNNSVFYVGKGRGSRIFDHVSCSLNVSIESDKIDLIREINLTSKVEHFILRHGLSEQEALIIESCMIDFIGIKNLTNAVSGHHSSDYGLKTTDEIIAMYSAQTLKTELPILLININKLYNPLMTRDEVYEATRKSWVLGPRKDKAHYAVATYRGLTREVYEITKWFEVGKRWGFEGLPAPEMIQQELRYKAIAEITKKGAANPIRYINC